MLKTRRFIQISILLGMFIVPVLNLLEIYFIRGTFISMDIGSLAIADPTMVLQSFFAGVALPITVLTSAIIPILLALILGRVWCGWACPYTTMMELLEKIPAIKRKSKAAQLKIIGGGSVKRANITRYLVFIGLLSMGAVIGIPILQFFSPPAVMSVQVLLAVKGFAITAELIFILIIVIVDIFFSHRFVCRYLCPTGACLSVLTTRKSLHIGSSGKCINCKKCQQVCPVGVNPMNPTIDKMCYNCGRCIAICPDKTEPLTWEI